MTPDWPALLARAQELDAPLTAEELELWKRGIIDGNARMWNVQYVNAAQAAVEQRDIAQLVGMMKAEIPIPAFLLPVIASLWEPRGGRRRQLTALQDQTIRDAFEKATAHLRMSDADAKKWLAGIFGVDVVQIRRSLARTADKTPPTI